MYTYQGGVVTIIGLGPVQRCELTTYQLIYTCRHSIDIQIHIYIYIYIHTHTHTHTGIYRPSSYIYTHTHTQSQSLSLLVLATAPLWLVEPMSMNAIAAGHDYAPYSHHKLTMRAVSQVETELNSQPCHRLKQS